MASREVQAILEYVKAAGIPYRITGILGQYISPDNPCSPHSRTSLHCAEGTNGKGLAVDFGGAVAGVTALTVIQMSAIRRAFDPVSAQLAECFFNGPGITKVIKNGVYRDGLACLGPVTWAAHKSHVHVAVPRGTFLLPNPTPVTKKVFPLYDPPHVLEPIVADLACPTGGAWLLAASGAVYGYGGAPYLGAPNGHDYFRGRVAARLEPVNDKYAVVAESGEKYGPGFG